MGEILEEKGIVPVGAYRLAYTRMGMGSPVVVLESPYGVPRSNWDQVMPEIAKFTRVISYDRGSLGESERAGRRRTLREVVRDLKSLLEALEEPGPYILVGSSIGGHIIRYFSYLHLEQVAGLVMIESTHPDSASRTLAVIPPATPEDSDFLKEMRYYLTHDVPYVDDPEHDLEGFDFRACDDQAREVGSLGDLPLVVIAAANHAKDAGDPMNDPRLVPPSLATAVEQAHLETQADLTRLSSRGRLLIARESGHLVQEDEPELVIGAIKEMVEEYRQTKHFPIPDSLTPAWLTMILHDAGILSSGAVASLEGIPANAFNSGTSFLHLRYTSDVPLNTPTRLVLKRNTPEAWSIAAGADEVRFYRLIAQLQDHPQVIPPCYAAEYEPSTGDSFLLLQDLSETHKPPITRDEQLSIVHGVPLVAYQESVIDLLAVLHAYWWDHRRLTEGEFEVGFWSLDSERFHQYLVKRSAAWQRIVTTYGERLPEKVHSLYERLFKMLPDFFTSVLAPRFTNRHNLTLIHGDTYFCNFLCPVIPGSAPTYLMDWQSPSVDLAAYDLVNLLAAYWTRDQRREENRERTLLRRYHQGLLSNGVQNYAWEDLVADYRAALIFWVLMPVQDGADGADWSYWWPKMQCLIAAFEDWKCEENFSLAR